MKLKLYDYWRSGAAYRVRIGLNLKGLAYAAQPVNLLKGEQGGEAYAAINPLGLVPALEVDGRLLTQSLAILEFLDEASPEPPLLPADAFERARVRALALTIAADTHPLHNLRVNARLKTEHGADDAAVKAWNGHWLHKGLAVLEAAVREHGRGYCYGERPGLLDCLLTPMLASARRFEVDLSAYPSLTFAKARAAEHPAFIAAAPDRQADAVRP